MKKIRRNPIHDRKQIKTKNRAEFKILQNSKEKSQAFSQNSNETSNFWGDFSA